MHPRVRMFLQERDRARARGDLGVIRSLTVELERLGVPPTATMADPSGKHATAATNTDKRKPGRPKLPRCEHGGVMERCPECNDEALAS